MIPERNATLHRSGATLAMASRGVKTASLDAAQIGSRE
jgi:hypothetical protein